MPVPLVLAVGAKRADHIEDRADVLSDTLVHVCRCADVSQVHPLYPCLAVTVSPPVSRLLGAVLSRSFPGAAGRHGMELPERGNGPGVDDRVQRPYRCPLHEEVPVQESRDRRIEGFGILQQPGGSGRSPPDPGVVESAGPSGTAARPAGTSSAGVSGRDVEGWGSRGSPTFLDGGWIDCMKRLRRSLGGRHLVGTLRRPDGTVSQYPQETHR